MSIHHILLGKALSSRFETRPTSFLEEIKSPTLDPNVGERLFPIDEITRLGLEKDGFHPYLELILSARKKISSVLEHLDSNWGRYGWISDLETKTLEQPSALAPFKVSSKLEDIQKGCNTDMQNRYGNGEKTEVRSEESEKAIIISGETNAVVAEKMPSNGSVDSMVQCQFLWPVF
ncbi:hypothetical protein REPUB_Repub10bG0089600 [Reevesia pubescens]